MMEVTPNFSLNFYCFGLFTHIALNRLLLQVYRAPTLWVIAQKESSRRVVEVGCECFFGLSGCISSGVRTYDQLALLASIVHNVYIDDGWVAAEYLIRCKAGSWKKENTIETVKCCNLEWIIDTEQRGEYMPEEVTILLLR